jgi:hypothetical protein
MGPSESPEVQIETEGRIGEACAQKNAQKQVRLHEIVAHLAPLRLSATEAAIIAPSHTIYPNSRCKPLGRRLAPTPP